MWVVLLGAISHERMHVDELANADGERLRVKSLVRCASRRRLIHMHREQSGEEQVLSVD